MNVLSGKLSAAVFSLVIFTTIFSASVLAITTIYTDKPDYAPTDTVTITGISFNTNDVVTILIIDPNGSNHISTNITNSSGIFTYYFTAGLVNGIYFVNASDGTNWATTTFTDDPPISFITILFPLNNAAVANPVRVNGTWNITNPPGQTTQEDIAIFWGDGNSDFRLI